MKLSAFDGGEPPVAGFVGRREHPDADVPDRRPRGRAVPRQVRVRPPGCLLHRLRSRQRPARDDGSAAAAVYAAGPADRDGPAQVPRRRSSPSQDVNFTAYWNQVTPENAGKWGSVEGTRDVMNWGELDAAYALAKTNGFPFRMHTLMWGNQQPAWIEALPPAEQREEIEEWFAAVAARYPDIDFIDVVNEPLHDPPDGAGRRQLHRRARRQPARQAGNGCCRRSGWRASTSRRARLGHQRVQRHEQHHRHAALHRHHPAAAGGSADRHGRRAGPRVLDARARTSDDESPTWICSRRPGLPIYVTELDIDGPTDEVQLADYQRIFPAFWEHPAVRGITLWGYRPGHWRTAQGAYIVLDNGAERPAMVWLQDYVANTTLRPWITAQPAPLTATVGDNVSLDVRGGRQRPTRLPVAQGRRADRRQRLGADPDAGAGERHDRRRGRLRLRRLEQRRALRRAAAPPLTVHKAVGLGHALSWPQDVYDGAPRAYRSPRASGLAVDVTYNGSADAADSRPGTYAVDRHDRRRELHRLGRRHVDRHNHGARAPRADAQRRIDGSVQVLLPESTTLNGGARVSGDLLMPGTPAVRLNGQPAYDGTIDGAGDASPSSHTVTMNGGADAAARRSTDRRRGVSNAARAARSYRRTQRCA